MSSNEEFARAFLAELHLLGEDIEVHVRRIWQESMTLATEAIVIGSQYGPGAPVDTEYLRSTFGIGRNGPAEVFGDRNAGARGGAAAPSLDLREIFDAQLGESVYLTTATEYAHYLEDGKWSRGDKAGTFARRTSTEQLNNKKGTGGPTPFVAPVAARWPDIVEDALQRVGPL